MSAPAFEFQKLVYETLSADVGISAVVTDVFDNVPSDAVEPYISFGPADEVPLDAEGITYAEHFLQVDIWSAKKATQECKELSFLIKKALHNQPLSIPEHAISNIHVSKSRIVPNPDDTNHGIVTIQALIEER